MESEAFICFSIFTSEDWEGKAVLEDRKAKVCVNNQPTGQLSLCLDPPAEDTADWVLH